MVDRVTHTADEGEIQPALPEPALSSASAPAHDSDSDDGYVPYSKELLDLLSEPDYVDSDDSNDSATGFCEEGEDEPDRSRFYLDREFDMQYRRNDEGEDEETSPPMCYESLAYEDPGLDGDYSGNDLDDDDDMDGDHGEDKSDEDVDVDVDVKMKVGDEDEVEDSEKSSNSSLEEDSDEDEGSEEDSEENEAEDEDEDDNDADEEDIDLPAARSGMGHNAGYDPGSPTPPRDLVPEESFSPPQASDSRPSLPSTPGQTPDVASDGYEREASTPAALPHTPASPASNATPAPRRARYVHTTPTSLYDTTDPHNLSLDAFLATWAVDKLELDPEGAAPHEPNGDDDGDDGSDLPPRPPTPAVIDERPFYTPGIEHRIPQDAVDITYPVRAERIPANAAALANPLIAAYWASQANTPAAAANATATDAPGATATAPDEPADDEDSEEEEDESSKFKLTPKRGFRFQHAETPQAGLSWNPGTPPCWIMVDATMYNFTRRGQLWGCGEVIDPKVIIGGKVFRLPPVVLKRCQPPNMPRPRVPKPSAQFAVSLNDIESSGAESGSEDSMTDSSDGDYSAGDTDVSCTDSESWFSDTTFSSATFSSTDSVGSNVSTGRMPWDWAKIALDNEFAAYVGLWDLMGIYIPTVYVWCAYGDDKQDVVVVADKAGPPIGRSWNAVDRRWKPQIVKLLNILARRGFARETLSVRHFRTMLDRPNRICLINFHDTTQHTGEVCHSRTYYKVLAALDQCRPCRSLGIPCDVRHRRRRAVVLVSKVSETQPKLPAPLPGWVLGKLQK